MTEATKVTHPKAAQSLRVNEEKWGKTLMDAGWTAIPSVIIEHQKALGLDAVDLAIIMHLAMYWWLPENKPRPAKATIAEALAMHPRTIQKRIAALEAAGFIHRQQRRTRGGSKPNYYHFDGLIAAAKPFAEQKLAARKAKDDEAKKRAAQKGRPRLVASNNED